MRRLLWFSGLLLILSASVQAQDVSRLTLDQLFTDFAFSDQDFGPARWLDGQTYTTLEPSPSGGTDLVRYDAPTGTHSVLVPARDLVPAGRSEPLRIANYHWSNDHQQLLIFTNTRRVWRINTRGDYWVLDLRTKALQKLGGTAPEATLMFAKFSPDGTRVGYVRENNLYVESLADGRITQLTHDGTRTIINGTFDWVYEEEFGLRDGFRWSPDGTRIAYWQLDASGIRDFLLLNNTDSLYSFVVPIQYPKVGTTNAAGRVGVVSAGGGTTTWFEPSQDLRNHYIARMEWVERTDELLLQHLNRKQNTLEVILANVHTGQMRTILTEQDSAWVEVVDDLRWLDGGQRFTWVSERSGWRHVWLVSRDGQQMRNLTPGAVDVIRVVQIDTRGGWLYYIASPDNPAQRYLFRTRLDGRGTPERLSPADQPGTHTYNLAPGGAWAIHSFSSFTTPPIIDVVRLPAHTPVQTLVDNAALRERLASVALGQSRFFRVDIGAGVLLDGWEIRPPEFDPARKYPVLFYVYGEPAGQTVLDQWDGFTTLWHHLLAQQGYVVISLDNRGTPAPRGRHWRKQIYGAIGVQASADQAAANRVIRQWPYVDSTRIGIWGWSGGGSMTLNMLFRYPDLYQTGMSVAPVPDQRLYDTIYQERYMGLPQENAEGYRLGSPITFAENLRGNLLVVHGTGDDNVHYQGTERLINTLIAHGKDFTMMAYPNRSHGIYEGEGTTRHLFGLLTRYLNQHLPAGGRSANQF
jgi:dipeptidyl-peptidase-4